MMNISENFTSWVKFLFGNASVVVNLNAILDKNFIIERGVRQGCPFALYLFLIVGEVLMHIIKKAATEGRLKRISLPGGKRWQSISQHADDSSFMIKRDKRYLDELVRLLKNFSEAYGMEINWEKKMCISVR